MDDCLLLYKRVASMWQLVYGAVNTLWFEYNHSDLSLGEITKGVFQLHHSTNSMNPWCRMTLPLYSPLVITCLSFGMAVVLNTSKHWGNYILKSSNEILRWHIAGGRCCPCQRPFWLKFLASQSSTVPTHIRQIANHCYRFAYERPCLLPLLP